MGDSARVSLRRRGSHGWLCAAQRQTWSLGARTPAARGGARMSAPRDSIYSARVAPRRARGKGTIGGFNADGDGLHVHAVRLLAEYEKIDKSIDYIKRRVAHRSAAM